MVIEQGAGVLLKRFGARRAHGSAENPAVAVDPDHVGHGTDAIGLRDLTAVEQNSLIQLLPLNVALDEVVLFVPGIDSQNDQCVIGMSFRDPADVRSLRTTGRSVIGPECEEYRLAVIVGETHFLLIEPGKLEVRGL